MKRSLQLAVLAAVFALPLSAQAHRGWILPSATVLSNNNPWVTFDAATSNDVFHADHNPFRIDGLKITAPDATEVKPENLATGKFRTVFDLNLVQRGTYKIFTASNGLSARWEEEGKRKSWPARGVVATLDGFEKEVPKKADKLEVAQASRRFETFVTSGKPSDSVFKPTNVGLELVPVTHPNDLFSGETAVFSFIIDGKPAANAEIEITPGARRYRNAEEAIIVTTDKQGKFSIKWPAAGTYFLEASYEDDKASKPATKRTGSYAAVFEVLPQ